MKSCLDLCTNLKDIKVATRWAGNKETEIKVRHRSIFMGGFLRRGPGGAEEFVCTGALEAGLLFLSWEEGRGNCE